MRNNQGMWDHIEFVNEAERQYFQEARLGEEVLSFLNSSTGRYLHGRAKLELEEVKQQMLELDPYDTEVKFEIARLQHKAAVAQKFMQWCADAITNGEAAYKQVQQIDEELR